MSCLAKIFDNWELKTVLSTLTALFSPYKWSVILLIAIIVIDTICGTFYAAKLGGLCSMGFKRSLTKIVTYSAAILVVRLAEAGLVPVLETTAASHVIISFLIITETISVLENLSLLGVPLPAGLARIVGSYVKNSALKVLLSEGRTKKEYEYKIQNSVNFQIPGFKSKKIKQLLKVLSEEWVPAIRAIDMQLTGNTTDNGDLIFYEVSGLVKITNSLITEKWITSRVPAHCVEAFNTLYSANMKKNLEPLEQLCHSQDPPDTRKKNLLECIIIALYRTIEELQKEEANLLKSKCKNL